MNQSSEQPDSPDEIPLAEAIPIAEAIEESDADRVIEANSVAEMIVELLPDDESVPIAIAVEEYSDETQYVRHGSPFAEAFKRVVRTPREQRFASRGAALGSIVLGCWTLVAVLLVSSPAIRLALFLNAMLGVALGAWGLTSPAIGRAKVGLGSSVAAAMLALLSSIIFG